MPHLSTLDEVRQHDYELNVFLPDHSPEVAQRVRFGSLRSNIELRCPVTLKMNRDYYKYSKSCTENPFYQKLD